MREEESTYEMVMPFLSDDPQFALGWEAALVYAQMRDRDRAIWGTYHAANDEMLLLMARRHGYEVVYRDMVGTWVEMAFRLKDGT